MLSYVSILSVYCDESVYGIHFDIRCFDWIFAQEKNDQQRSKAKQDVGELLGKGEKKKRNSKIGGVGGMSNGTGNDLGPIGKGMAPLASLERKPLPGIQSIGSISNKSQSWAGLSSNIKETNSPTNLVSISVQYL